MATKPETGIVSARRVGIDAGGGGQPGRIDAKRFQALAQHFPALAEGCRRHLLERAAVARLRRLRAASAAPPTT